MEFDGNKPIYLQICEEICEKVLSGALKEDERILSVREFGASIGVNPNTVSRSYEKLTDEGIIYNKRGIGFFVSEGAREKVLKSQRREFIENEWPTIKKRMELLGINATDLN